MFLGDAREWSDAADLFATAVRSNQQTLRITLQMNSLGRVAQPLLFHVEKHLSNRNSFVS